MNFSDVKAWVEKHPYVTGGTIFIGGALLIYLYYSGSNQPVAQATTPAQDTTSAYDSELAAELANESAQGQQQVSLQALSDQLSAATASINGQVSVASINASADEALASLNAQTADDSINMYGGVQSLGILANESIASTNASAAMYQASLAAFSNVTDNYFATTQNINTTNAELANNLGQADLAAQTEQNITDTLAAKIT